MIKFYLMNLIKLHDDQMILQGRKIYFKLKLNSLLLSYYKSYLRSKINRLLCNYVINVCRHAYS